MFQTTNHILMVRPANFGFNEQTAESNAFQTNDTSLSQKEISEKAIAEFDAFVEKLRSVGVQVIVAEDSKEPVKHDAIFPNNWVTFHEDGKVITYPMYAPMRRLERQRSILQQIENQFVVKSVFRMEDAELEGFFLEGTGSMILDRPKKIVYACLSPRTDEVMLDKFCTITGFTKVVFTSVDGKGQEIYHTNVMMALGETFAVICLDTIPNPDERKKVVQALTDSNKAIIEISQAQVLSFAGNMLQVKGANDTSYIVMSEQAYQSLTASQIQEIELHTNILAIPIPIIETYGGGSVRCMMAEVFLQEK
jgi:hypothetical protein